MRSLNPKALAIAAALIASSVAAIAANTTFFTSIGDLVFPFSPPSNGGATPGTIDNMTIGATTPQPGFFSTVNSGGEKCTVTPCDYIGLSAAQGGNIHLRGGPSSTSANAGGNSRLFGGAPGATGVGGIASIEGSVGGSTSGAGGLASVTGGAGTAGNSAGGAAAEAGGAGQGSAAGGAASVTGGVGGATGAGGAAAIAGGAGGATSGNGGVASVTGGAATAGNGNGGSAIVQGGAGQGSGIAGSVRELGLVMRAQGAAVAHNTAATLAVADMTGGIITSGPAAAIALTLPLATAVDTAIPDAVAGDSFDFSVINTSTTGANTDTLGTASGWTLVGSMVVTPVAAGGTSGRFRAAKTAAGAWTLFRLS